MGEASNPLLTSALDLARRGFRVFPLKVNDWRPAVEGWQNLATTDEDQITKVWTKAPFNIGVCGGNGLLIVDVDMKRGKNGIATAAALGVGLDGFVVKTPSGGRHVYMHGPDISNSVGKLGEGVDTRSAGGYVVGPGSFLPDGAKDGQAGGIYVVEKDEALRNAPTSLIHRLTAPVERVQTTAHVTADTPQAVSAAIDYLARAHLANEGEAGDITTFQVAARLKDYGVSQDMAVDLMVEHWNDRCSPPWDIEDLKTKVANAYEYGTSQLGILSPVVDFHNVKPIPPMEEPPASIPSAWFRHGDARGEVSWLYHNLIPRTGVGVLLAPSQAGKTFVAIEAARSLATGKSFFKEEPEDLGGTLFVFAGTEGSGLALRLDALQEDMRLPISATSVGNLSNKDALTNLLDALKEEAAYILATHGVPVRLVVLETMAASGLLVDENDNSEASRAMANLAQISRAMNAFVLTSHHPAKDGKGARGASAIPNSADYVIEIYREGRSAVREVEITKARDAEQRKLGTFTLLPVELGHDQKGRPITSMVISTGDVMSNAMRMAPFVEALLTAVDWSTTENGEDVHGQRAVDEDFAKDAFKDTKGGPRDRSTVTNAFKAALGWCEQIGSIEVLAFAGRKYLRLKEKIVVPDIDD